MDVGRVISLLQEITILSQRISCVERQSHRQRGFIVTSAQNNLANGIGSQLDEVIVEQQLREELSQPDSPLVIPIGLMKEVNRKMYELRRYFLTESEKRHETFSQAFDDLPTLRYKDLCEAVDSLPSLEAKQLLICLLKQEYFASRAFYDPDGIESEFVQAGRNHNKMGHAHNLARDLMLELHPYALMTMTEFFKRVISPNDMHSP